MLADAIGWIGDVLGMTITTFGEAPDPVITVTLGMLLAVTLILGFGVGAFKKLRGRG